MPRASRVRIDRDRVVRDDRLAPDDYSPTVGQVLTSVCVALRDWEEGGYRVEDEKNPSIGFPRGEILIGGPVVCQGYYTASHMPDPELAAKNTSEFSVIDGVRYFHTGDVGQFARRSTHDYRS